MGTGCRYEIHNESRFDSVMLYAVLDLSGVIGGSTSGDIADPHSPTGLWKTLRVSHVNPTRTPAMSFGTTLYMCTIATCSIHFSIITANRGQNNATRAHVKMLQFLGERPPDPYRGFAHGPHWGTSVSQTPYFRRLEKIFSNPALGMCMDHSHHLSYSLPRDAMLALYMQYADIVCPPNRCSTKMAKHRITKSSAYDSPETLVSWCQKSRRNSKGVTPNKGDKQKCGRLKRLSTISRYISGTWLL